MKKIAVTIGLATAGAAGVHAAYAPDASDNKNWSVSALLRGLYNDNPGAVSTGSKGSFGYSVAPQFQIVKPYNQTEMGLRYIYTLIYYSNQGGNPYDQSHWVNLWLDHVFSERWEMKVSDGITASQNPMLGVNGDQGTSNPFRNGNYVNNAGTVSVHTDWTREFGTVLTYGNNFYSYNQGGAQITNSVVGGVTNTIVNPSYAGQFDRVDQNIGLDLQWHATSETIYGVGYSFDWVNFTAGEPVADNTVLDKIQYSDVRDSYTHTAYLSWQHNNSDRLHMTLLGGIQINDSYNQDLPSTIYPYFNLSSTYNYAPSSYVSLGFMQGMNTTYLPLQNNHAFNTNSGTITAFQESSTVYATLNHQITPKLVGLLTARYQLGTFKGGPYNNSDTYYSVSANLNYAINPHFSAEIGYSFDQVESVEPGSSYIRNQYEIGVTASY